MEEITLTKTTDSPELLNLSILQRLNEEFSFQPAQIRNTLELLEADNSIPFIARYRKEKTGNLDEVQIADLFDRYHYFKDLDARRETILTSIQRQGKLNPELEQKIRLATTKQQLEDWYLPYKPKRRTRATTAKEKGLAPLAELIQQTEKTKEDAQTWIQIFNAKQKTPLSEEEIWQGVRYILAEQVVEDAETRDQIRQLTWKVGSFLSKVKSEFAEKKTKFTMYYDFDEPVAKIQAHRYLAIRRGEKENILKISIDVPQDQIRTTLVNLWLPQIGEDFHEQLFLCLEDAYDRLLRPSIETDIRMDIKRNADGISIELFSKNFRQLLLQPPGGSRRVMGLDPAFRTGTKWVVIEETGKPLEHGVIYPVEPQHQVEEARKTIREMLENHSIDVIVIGNGTASREVQQFIHSFIKEEKLDHVQQLIVNESGASVYSASEIARSEFPDLDLTVRGSISIARRYQDPLAELVKIEPKSIGVGQYQHDVNQKQLKQSLDRTVESCVNYVGVELNRASAPLLSYVSGISQVLARRVVEYRNAHGAFHNRQELFKVSGFGQKTFEQAAGFLRIADAVNPLGFLCRSP